MKKESYKELMNVFSWSMSLFLADDSANEIFCESWVNSKSRSDLPRKTLESFELSTDFS